jgi:hypothetical protein
MSTKKDLKEVDQKQELEKMELISRADEIKGEQLSIGLQGEILTENELRKFALGDIENPEKKYDVYYNGISRLLRKHLPKGEPFKKARYYIYEEKNTFLTRGHRINKQGIRGADGRMGHLDDAEFILKTITDWIIEGGTMVDLFSKIRNQNLERGYGKPSVEN